MKFKKWFRRISIFKYPAVIIICIWGTIPALQPGVSGLKSQTDHFLGSTVVRRVKLSQINLGSQSTPSWCISLTHNAFRYDHSATCGFSSGKQQLVREMYWDGSWNGLATIYKMGDILDYSQYPDVDLSRDWKWLEFFYGYGPLSTIGAAVLRSAYVHMYAGFYALCSFFLFLIFDTFVLAFMLCRFLVKKIRQ